MKLSIATIQKWLNKQKARRHEEIKKQIAQLQINRNFAVVTNQEYKIAKLDKKIKRLQRKLNAV